MASSNDNSVSNVDSDSATASLSSKRQPDHGETPLATKKQKADEQPEVPEAEEKVSYVSPDYETVGVPAKKVPAGSSTTAKTGSLTGNSVSGSDTAAPPPASSAKRHPEVPDAENPLAAKKQKGKVPDLLSDQLSDPDLSSKLSSDPFYLKKLHLSAIKKQWESSAYQAELAAKVAVCAKNAITAKKVIPGAPAVVPPNFPNFGSSEEREIFLRSAPAGYVGWYPGPTSILFSDKKKRFKKGVNPVEIIEGPGLTLRKLEEISEEVTDDSDGSNNSSEEISEAVTDDLDGSNNSSDGHGHNKVDPAPEVPPIGEVNAENELRISSFGSRNYKDGHRA